MKKTIFILFFITVSLLTTWVYRGLNQKWLAYHKAEKLFEKGQYSRAVNYYILAIQEGIAADFITNHLYQSLRSIKEVKRSVDLFTIFIERGVKEVQTFHNLADFYVEIKHYNEAEKVYLYVLTLDPQENISRFMLGQILTEQGKYSEAIEQYKILLGNDL